jgi:hypothetical protein
MLFYFIFYFGPLFFIYFELILPYSPKKMLFFWVYFINIVIMLKSIV